MKTTTLQIITCLFLGASLPFLVISFFIFTFNPPNYPIFFAPWLEEGLKFLSALILIRFVFLTPALVPFLGIGFGVAENFGLYLQRGREASIIPLGVHIALGLIMACFFYLAQKSETLSLRNVFYMLAFLVPALLHFFWNFVVT